MATFLLGIIETRRSRILQKDSISIQSRPLALSQRIFADVIQQVIQKFFQIIMLAGALLSIIQYRELTVLRDTNHYLEVV